MRKATLIETLDLPPLRQITREDCGEFMKSKWSDLYEGVVEGENMQAPSNQPSGKISGEGTSAKPSGQPEKQRRSTRSVF